MYQLWKTLHIMSMFLAFAFFMAPNLLAMRAIARKDRALLVQAVEFGRTADKLGGMSVGLGVILGIVTALTGGLSLLKPWLVSAYVLLAIIIAVGEGLVAPGLRRAAAGITGAGAGAADTGDAIVPSSVRALMFVPPVLFLTIVVFMVTKPFSG